MSKHPSTQILPSQSIKHPPIKSYLTLCFSSFSTIRVTLSTNKSALGRESDNITKTAQLRLTPMLRRLFHSGKYLLNNTLMEGRPMYTRMMQKFAETFDPVVLEVRDESQMHAEHVAMRNSGFLETHFKYFQWSSSSFVSVLIVSDKFVGKLPVVRHRMVYSLLNDEFQAGLHAVNIVAKTPLEYQQPQ